MPEGQKIEKIVKPDKVIEKAVGKIPPAKVPKPEGSHSKPKSEG